MKKRNCYLDLHFHPSSPHSSPSHNSMNVPLKINKQLVTIHHNRRHYIFDVTELQARVIIWLASREMRERNGSTGPVPTSSSLSLQSQALLMHAPRGLSIKRSLQNFLKKRKKRSQSSHISNIATPHTVK